MKAYEEIKKLEAALSGDQDLRERYREKVEDLAKQNGTLRLSELAALAAEQIGYNLSASAFETAAQMQAIDDDEIEAVSGGRSVDTEREPWSAKICTMPTRRKNCKSGDPQSL